MQLSSLYQLKGLNEKWTKLVHKKLSIIDLFHFSVGPCVAYYELRSRLEAYGCSLQLA